MTQKVQFYCTLIAFLKEIKILQDHFFGRLIKLLRSVETIVILDSILKLDFSFCVFFIISSEMRGTIESRGVRKKPS